TWDQKTQMFVDSRGNPSSFDSIPSAFWFVMVTITTTGYGDMVPTTFVGKLIAFPAMMCGILLIALPSIIVGRNFTLVWEAMRQYRR
ncbi:15403_t:CDS:2, partial [Acaulospora morrowiae]